MKKQVFLGSLALAVMVCSGVSTANADSSRVLRLSTDHTHDFVTTVALREFADDVAKRTNNRIKIEVFDGGQLGDEKACLEQVQFGAIDMTKNSLAPLAEFVPDMNALNLPYLFRDVDHMWKTLDSKIGDEFMKKLEDMNMYGIAWIDAGSRCFYSVDPLTGPEGIKGKKVRVQESKIMLHMVESLGGLPVAMPASDVYSSLQTGVVQVAENNVPRFLDMSHNEIAKNLILDRHNILPEALLISKITMDSLDPADQQIIRDAAKDLQKAMIKKWADNENAILKKLEGMGVTVVVPDANTIAEFRKLCQPVYDVEGKPYQDIVNEIENIK